jgi:hypothetical protein
MGRSPEEDQVAESVLALLDTTAVVESAFLTSPSARLLLTAGEARAIRIAVPRLVLDETLMKYEALADQAATDVAGLRRTFERKLGMEAPTLPTVDPKTLKEQFGKVLKGYLDMARVKIPDYPSVAHAEVTARALRRRPPFDDKGSGYRDTLVWFTVRELATQGNIIVLVTGDKRAFGELDDLHGLHPSLREELAALGVADGSITRVRGVKELVAGHVPESALMLHEFRNKVKADSVFVEHLKEVLSETALYTSLDFPDAAHDLDSPIEIENPFIEHVEDIENIDVSLARRGPGGEVLLTITASLEIVFEAYTHKANLYAEDLRDLYVSDPDHNRHYATVQGGRTVEVEFQVAWDGSEALTAAEVVGVL